MLDILKDIIRDGLADEWPTPRFVTRVVGLCYEDRQKALAALHPAMPVSLVLEPENRYDPNAVAVVAPRGAQLGYLRASLAALLARRYARGGVFAARVAAVMEVRRETVDG